MKRTLIRICFVFISGSLAVAIQSLDQQLFDAAINGKAETVRVLLKKGANASATVSPADREGATALMAAVSLGHVLVARQLLAAGARVNAQDRDHVTALMLAAMVSSAESVELLLHSGAEVNSKTVSGQTALMLAAALAKRNVVQTLLGAKPDVNTQDEDGWTALDWADLNNDQQVPELLRQAGGREGPVKFVASELVNAAGEGDIATVRRLMDRADVNATDHAGHTALVMAAETGQIEMVKFLLSAGANPNITDNVRPRGLAMIVSEGVVIAGIDEVIETKRYQGITPLGFAARFGHAEIIRILLEAGAKVNMKTGNFTPLLLGVQGEERSETVRQLLNAGAEVNVQDKEGMTPLMIAALRRDKATVRLLLDHGANTQLKDKDGNTALWWARDAKDIVALLKAAERKETK